MEEIIRLLDEHDFEGWVNREGMYVKDLYVKEYNIVGSYFRDRTIGQVYLFIDLRALKKSKTIDIFAYDYTDNGITQRKGISISDVPILSDILIKAKGVSIEIALN